MLFRSQNTSVAIWSSWPAGLRFVQVSDLPRHENISTLDLVSNKTKGSQAHTYCHDCHGETLFNISTPVVTWCRKNTLLPESFLHCTQNSQRRSHLVEDPRLAKRHEIDTQECEISLHTLDGKDLHHLDISD